MDTPRASYRRTGREWMPRPARLSRERAGRGDPRGKNRISRASPSSGRLWGIVALGRQVTFGRAAAGIALTAGAVVLPIALARPRPAAASAFVFAHQRAPVLDALRTQELA